MESLFTKGVQQKPMGLSLNLSAEADEEILMRANMSLVKAIYYNPQNKA